MLVRFLLCLLLATHAARAGEKIRFGLDWLAEAEYGGYYQALARGFYAREGLDVTIEQGGPQVNQAQKLLGHRLDFAIAGNSFILLNQLRENIPLVAVAAFFQKDPSILLAHPGVGHDSFASLRGAPIMIGADTRIGWWNFVRQKFGYTDDQIRPYAFSLAPFLANPQSAQQGYLGSEPFLVEQEGHFRPVILALADAGFAGYASLIETRRETLSANPETVRKFIRASIAGWRDFLGNDPEPGEKLILAANPDMTRPLLEYGRRALIDHAIVQGPDGIGAMTQARWQAFYDSMVKAGLYPAGMDIAPAFTTAFLAP